MLITGKSHFEVSNDASVAHSASY